MKFEELNLPSFIIDALKANNIIEMTEIQEKSIPTLIEKKDLIGQSRTGSGKTFAYGIPSIVNLNKDIDAVQTLVVCPTRELAIQVCSELRKLCGGVEGYKVTAILGGENMKRQIIALKSGTKIVVGTPGRILDHLKRRTLKTDSIAYLVLDEADEMLNMGFIDDIKDIIKKLPTTHQTAMFSATMPKPILDLTKNFMNDPKFVKVESTNDEIKEIKQYYTMVGRNEKYNALIELYKTFNPKLSLIFCNTKRQVDVIHAKMTQDGFYVLSIHGDMTQYERKQTMKKVKNNECNILIGTDILARGIDINDVDYVFNYDLPIEDEYYVHRIGRTGRAGKSGTAVSIITTKNQITQMNNLAKLTHGTVDEYKLVPSKITLTEYLAKNSALNNAEVKEQTSSDDTQNTQVENTTTDSNTDTKLDVEKTKKDFYRKDKKFKDEDKRFMEKDENTIKNDVNADFNDKKQHFDDNNKHFDNNGHYNHEHGDRHFGDKKHYGHSDHYGKFNHHDSFGKSHFGHNSNDSFKPKRTGKHYHTDSSYYREDNENKENGYNSKESYRKFDRHNDYKTFDSSNDKPYNHEENKFGDKDSYKKSYNKPFHSHFGGSKFGDHKDNGGHYSHSFNHDSHFGDSKEHSNGDRHFGHSSNHSNHFGKFNNHSEGGKSSNFSSYNKNRSPRFNKFRKKEV